jgi:hypothetical protein
MPHKHYQTQWSAQFFAAAELTRRGYLVTLTFGNAPVIDILAQSPKGVQFSVDVKGQSTKNFWLIQRRESLPHHYYILVYVPAEAPPTYLVMSCEEMMKRRVEYQEHIVSTGGKYRDDLGGMNWSTALNYKDKWNTLPK